MKNSNQQARPPKIARKLLSSILRSEQREEYARAMEELFAARVQGDGRPSASLWYWRQTLGFVVRWRTLRRDPASLLNTGSVASKNRRGASHLEAIGQDIRFAIRTLGRRPLFTLVVIATLGLGIGATTTIYSVVDAVLLRSLPYSDADRLVSIWTSRLNSRDEWVTESLYPPEYRDLLAHASTLENTALYYYAGGSLQGHGDPMNLTIGEGTATLAEVAGIQPQLGRWFRPEEVGPNATYVAVLGDALWRERFGADPNVVGTTILLEHAPYTVIGVMPSEFRFRIGLFEDSQGLLSPQDSGERPVWVPMGHNYGARGSSDWYYQKRGWSFEAIARLRAGVSLEAAHAEIESLVRADTPADQIQVHLAERDQIEVAGLPAQILLLAIPSALLLLIAVGNVATLLLGESEGRKSEIATRLAIGAGAGRILQQLLTESVLLGLAGSMAGITLAFVGTRTLVALAPASSAIETIQVNVSVLGFASVAGILAGIAFGLAPALLLSRRGNGHRLGSRVGSPTAQGRQRIDLLIGFEVGLTVVLLVSGGLFTRTLLNLTAVNIGFEPENLVAFRAAIDDGLDREGRAAAYVEMLAKMEAVPGVEQATGSWAMPLLMGLWSQEIATEANDVTEGDQLPVLSYDVVMPDYHETMGIPLVAGRHFAPSDGPGGPPVAIVSESSARDLWPSGSAIGKRFRFGNDPDWHTVVGVAEDVRYGGLASAPRSPVYLPFLQRPGQNGIRLVLTARTRVEPESILPQLEAAARSAYPSVLLREGRLMSSTISNSATDQRYRALLVATFGLAAVLLAGVGIFGVVARAVAQRSHEMAIRMAVGADPNGLRSLILSGTLITGGIGVLGGLVVAGWGSRFLETFLFRVESSDPLTYGLVTLMVLLVCLAAGYLPARRLLLLQPAGVLKGE